MAAKNAYMEQQQAIRQKFLDVGEEMGMQKMWDYVQTQLRNPEVVGKDIFGRERMEKLYKGCMEAANHYHTAFTEDVEADYVQEELDGHLREIWEDDLTPFYERYPYLKQTKYDKAKKGWK